MDFIQQMRASGNKLLETEAQDLATWSKLKHNKQDLELFLNFNIAEIEFKTKSDEKATVIGTANTSLVKVFSEKKDVDKQKAAKLKSSGMRTKDSTSVQIWDLVENKPKTIMLSAWSIKNFISISEKNILVLDEVLRDLLKKR